jgi:two-component system nitrogen regulation response regulator GlnG
MPDFDATTQRRASDRPSTAKPAVPCLTILAHADARRIGERALLPSLLVAQAVTVARLDTAFIPIAGGPARPLEDPYLSRKPACTISASGRSLIFVDVSAGSTVNGRPGPGVHEFSRAELARGIVLSLEDRVALLLHETSNPPPCVIPSVLGDSDAIAGVRSEILRVADTSAPVLIRGETGVGKEFVARAIHELGPRRGHEWVAVNMAALTETIAVATLFGHAKGAFTGAAQKHHGVFERAAGSTLFLDEIGETPEGVQPMLLRALETGSILPVGAESERAVDVRVLAATDADLEQDVARRSFRAALLHRIAAHEIRVPPLRERRDDIARLLLHFLALELRDLSEPNWLLSPEFGDELPIPVSVLTRLVEHPLPGNVRQLRNLARHLALASRGVGRILAGEGFDRLLSTSPSTLIVDAPGPISVRPVELTDERILAALEENDFAPGKTAAALGLPTSTLHDVMRRLGIRRASDLSDAELAEVSTRFGGDVDAMARELRVSPRALRLALGRLNRT